MMDKRVRCQIELALLNNCNDDKTLQRVQDSARNAGLLTAEIDAALAQRSFDIRTHAAIRLACAIQHGDPTSLFFARKRARAIGITAQTIADIEQLVHAMPQRNVAPAGD